MKKAAFLLFAAAWLTGSAQGHGRSNGCCPAPCPAPSCNPCNQCCEREGLLDRLRGLFRRSDCCDACPAPRCEVRCCAPTRAPACCDHGPRCRLHRRNDCCQTVCRPTNCCDDCHRPSLLERIRNRFRRNNCCDPCCNPCGSGGAVVTPKSGEVITTPPKKLPGGGSGKTSFDGTTGDVRIITPPVGPTITPPAAPTITPPAITIPATPGLEPRNPF